MDLSAPGGTVIRTEAPEPVELRLPEVQAAMDAERRCRELALARLKARALDDEVVADLLTVLGLELWLPRRSRPRIARSSARA